jgi:hypothetical protein
VRNTAGNDTDTRDVVWREAIYDCWRTTGKGVGITNIPRYGCVGREAIDASRRAIDSTKDSTYLSLFRGKGVEADVEIANAIQ